MILILNVEKKMTRLKTTHKHERITLTFAYFLVEIL